LIDRQIEGMPSVLVEDRLSLVYLAFTFKLHFLFSIFQTTLSVKLILALSVF
jgi:hypothetical protein